MRADRLLSMLLMLHGRKRMTAADLAEALNVSERTIYRDVEALCIAGIPIYTQPGANGGITLDEDYRLALSGLSTAEISSLFAKASSGPLTDLGLAEAVENGLMKLLGALPTLHRDQAEMMRQRIHIDPQYWFDDGEPVPHLAALQDAVWREQEVKFTYQRPDGVISERILQPYALVAKSNIWYVVGRKPDGDIRTYRVARIATMKITSRPFERDAEFDLQRYWRDFSAGFEQKVASESEPCTVRLRVHPEWLWIVTNDMAGRYTILDTLEDNWIYLEMAFGTTYSAVGRIWGLAQYGEVLEPEWLREELLAKAKALLEQYE